MVSASIACETRSAGTHQTGFKIVYRTLSLLLVSSFILTVGGPDSSAQSLSIRHCCTEHPGRCCFVCGDAQREILELGAQDDIGDLLLPSGHQPAGLCRPALFGRRHAARIGDVGARIEPLPGCQEADLGQPDFRSRRTRLMSPLLLHCRTRCIGCLWVGPGGDEWLVNRSSELGDRRRCVYNTGMSSQWQVTRRAAIYVWRSSPRGALRHLVLSFDPQSPSITSTTPLGSVVAPITASWSDGNRFNGTCLLDRCIPTIKSNHQPLRIRGVPPARIRRHTSQSSRPSEGNEPAPLILRGTGGQALGHNDGGQPFTPLSHLP